MITSALYDNQFKKPFVVYRVVVVPLLLNAHIRLRHRFLKYAARVGKFHPKLRVHHNAHIVVPLIPPVVVEPHPPPKKDEQQLGLKPPPPPLLLPQVGTVVRLRLATRVYRKLAPQAGAVVGTLLPLPRLPLLLQRAPVVAPRQPAPLPRRPPNANKNAGRPAPQNAPRNNPPCNAADPNANPSDCQPPNAPPKPEPNLFTPQPNRVPP